MTKFSKIHNITSQIEFTLPFSTQLPALIEEIFKEALAENYDRSKLEVTASYIFENEYPTADNGLDRMSPAKRDKRFVFYWQTPNGLERLFTVSPSTTSNRAQVQPLVSFKGFVIEFLPYSETARSIQVVLENADTQSSTALETALLQMMDSIKATAPSPEWKIK